LIVVTMAKLACLMATSCFGQDLFLAPSTYASKTDLMRASSKNQTTRLGGVTPQEIADKINKFLLNSPVQNRDCHDHSVDELNDLVRQMFPHLSTELSVLYNEADGRSNRLNNLDEYEKLWLSEVDSDTTREGKCAEVIMLWAHHLSEASKQSLAISLPSLPVHDPEKSAESELYSARTSCVTGHAMVAGGDGSNDHQWPNWPEELHYHAKGHGAYPFWWGGGSDSGDADLEVWYSEKFGAEKFYHSSCTGQSSWLSGACTHLMFASGRNEGQAYLYTNDKCCKSQATSGGFGPTEVLSPPQGNFVDVFSYQGEVDFNGVYYQGKAKYYTMKLPNSEPVQDFWYFTDLDGKPVQQGEAGVGPTDQGYPSSRGHTIWHDYNPSSLDTSGIDDSVFDIPAICKSTSLTCAFP